MEWKGMTTTYDMTINEIDTLIPGYSVWRNHHNISSHHRKLQMCNTNNELYKLSDM